jgi:uncharacterized OB-fold protein
MPPPSAWRHYPQRYRREATRCTGCGKAFFPPRLVCDKCGARDFETFTLGTTGKLATFTIIRTPAAQFSGEAPFALGIVDMEEGVRLMAQVADVAFDELKVGMPVKLEFRQLYSDGSSGVIHYGHKAVPLRE